MGCAISAARIARSAFRYGDLRSPDRLIGPDGVRLVRAVVPSAETAAAGGDANAAGAAVQASPALRVGRCRRSSHFAPAAIQRRITAICSAVSRSFSFGGICSASSSQVTAR